MNIRYIYLPHRLGLANATEGETKPVVAAVQKELTLRGLYSSEAHGTLDGETRDALAVFQDRERLAATGMLDPVTYCRLQEAHSMEIEAIADDRRVSHALARGNILIAKSKRQLTLFDGNTPVRQYPVAIGKPGTPTPLGNFAIATKIPNPGGVLGTRWMGLNYDAYGIHGTNRPWLIGQMVSNGCIRMHNANAEELFVLVNVGTPVYIRD